MAKDNKGLDAMTDASNEIEDISKIRDILFGNNMSEYEKRFARLEDKLAQSISENKVETDKKISALDLFLRKELKSLGEQISEEEESREKSDKKLLAEIESLEQSLKKFKQATNDNFSEDRQQVMEMGNTLGDQISNLSKALQNRLEDSNSLLQTNKVERSSLAMMLTDLAYKIAGENETSEDEQKK